MGVDSCQKILQGLPFLPCRAPAFSCSPHEYCGARAGGTVGQVAVHHSYSTALIYLPLFSHRSSKFRVFPSDARLNLNSSGAAQKQPMHRDCRDYRGCREGAAQICKRRKFYIPIRRKAKSTPPSKGAFIRINPITKDNKEL